MPSSQNTGTGSTRCSSRSTCSCSSPPLPPSPRAPPASSLAPRSPSGRSWPARPRPPSTLPRSLPVPIEQGREAADGAPLGAGGAAGGKLLLFLVIVVQGSDVLQYIWGKLFGRHPIAPSVSPNKTWEGFIGGVLTATVLGSGLAWLTPFAPWQAGVMAFISCVLGFAGGLVMSSIKRDRDIKDFGALIPGHGGVMDRL